MVLFQINSLFIPVATHEPARIFAHFRSQKSARFSAGQNECFHPAKHSFYPPAVTAGITHYTLHAKPCAKGRLLWNPPFCREASIARKSEAVLQSSKTQAGDIGQPVPGADLCCLLAYMGVYCIAHINRSNLSFPYVRSICRCRTAVRRWLEPLPERRTVIGAFTLHRYTCRAAGRSPGPSPRRRWASPE